MVDPLGQVAKRKLRGEQKGGNLGSSGAVIPLRTGSDACVPEVCASSGNPSNEFSLEQRPESIREAQMRKIDNTRGECTTCGVDGIREGGEVAGLEGAMKLED